MLVRYTQEYFEWNIENSLKGKFMFIDEIIIHVKAGKGGDGCVSFRRERFIPKGGPDGGDGGRGGSVYIKADLQLKTLNEYYRNPHRKAQNGENGSSGKKNGKNGSDLYLYVPVGTVVEDNRARHIMADLSRDREKVCVACGGLGGRGNYRFKSSTFQSPKFAQKGEKGEQRTIKLDLKLIADVALVGFPNAGKSTFLARVSRAKPKIADYPFTTVNPHLGIVTVDREHKFVLADIPGLIEGAAQGAGLGIKFLKHIERTKAIVHLIDGSRSSAKKIIKDYHIIRNELVQFSSSLSSKEEIIVISKYDLPEVQEKVEEIRKSFSKEGKSVFFISALTGEGISGLISRIFETIKLIGNKEDSLLPLAQEKMVHYDFRHTFTIKKVDNQFVIEGREMNKLAYQYDLNNPQALAYFQEKLKGWGVEKALKKKGAQEGDIVRIGEKEFYFFP